MATTTSDLINNSLRNGAIKSASALLSSVLAPFYNPLLPDSQQIKHLDLSVPGIAPLASNAALAGLNLFTNLETLILTGSPIPTWACDISHLTKLKKLVLYHAAVADLKSQVTGDLDKMPDLEYIDLGTPYGWTGDLSARTNIKYFFGSMTYDSDVAKNPRKPITIPTIGLNKGLTFCLLNYVKNTQTLTAGKIGTISDLMSLTTLNLTGCTADVTTINYILAQLKILKTAGGVIATVVLTGAGMAAPTGQGATDKAALITAGVSVTTT
jgi:hypothetical protein